MAVVFCRYFPEIATGLTALAMTKLTVCTAVLTRVIARSAATWQSQGTNSTNKMTFLATSFPEIARRRIARRAREASLGCDLSGLAMTFVLISAYSRRRLAGCCTEKRGRRILRHPLQNKQETNWFPAYFVACGRVIERERGSRPPLSHFPCQVFLHDLRIFLFCDIPLTVSRVTSSASAAGRRPGPLSCCPG